MKTVFTPKELATIADNVRQLHGLLLYLAGDGMPVYRDYLQEKIDYLLNEQPIVLHRLLQDRLDGVRCADDDSPHDTHGGTGPDRSNPVV